MVAKKTPKPKVRIKPKAAYDYLPIYDRNIFFGNDVTAISKCILEYFKLEAIDIGGMVDNEKSLGFMCPIINTEDPTIEKAYILYVKDTRDHSTIAHEITHLVNRIFQYLGQDVDTYNDEAQAYLAGYLTERFHVLMNGYKAKEVPLKKLKKRK